MIGLLCSICAAPFCPGAIDRDGWEDLIVEIAMTLHQPIPTLRSMTLEELLRWHTATRRVLERVAEE